MNLIGISGSGLHQPSAWTAASTAVQPRLPAGLTQAELAGCRFARCRRNSPARCGCRSRKVFAPRPAIGLPTDNKACGSATFTGQLQPPPGGQVHTLYLGEHGADAYGRECIFCNRQGFSFVARADLDQAFGWKTQPSQTWREQIIAPQHPNRLAASGQGCGEAGRKGRRTGPRLDLHALTGKLMPAAQRQTPFQEPCVETWVA